MAEQQSRNTVDAIKRLIRVALAALLLLVGNASASTLALIGSGTITTNGGSTGSLPGWGTNTACLIAVVTAYQSSAPDSWTIAGGGVAAWESLGGGGSIVVYQTRRAASFYLAKDGLGGNLVVPDGGALTITANGGTGDFRETQWYAFEIAEFDSAGLIDDGPVATFVGTGGSALNSDDVGVIDTSELVVAIAGFEGTSATFTLSTGNTEVAKITGTADVRQSLLLTSPSDDTPGISWTGGTGAGAGIVAFIASHGATGSHAGGGDPGSIPIIYQHLRRQKQ